MSHFNKKNFTFINTIGHGSYGSVKWYKNYNSEESVAIKVISGQDGTISESAIKEIDIYRTIQNVYGSCTLFPELFKVTFSISGKTKLWVQLCSYDLLSFYKKISKEQRLDVVHTIAKQTISALHLLHKLDIVHRDIKPMNILVLCQQDNYYDIQAKITDFGSCRRFVKGKRPRSLTAEVITFYYRPLEVANCLFNKTPPTQCNYDHKVDIWSLGVTLCDFITNSYLFQPNTNNELIRLINNKTKGDQLDLLSHFNSMNIIVPDQLLNLLHMMLTIDPKKRISSYDAVNHSYFDSDPIKLPQRNLTFSECKFRCSTPVLKCLVTFLHCSEDMPLSIRSIVYVIDIFLRSVGIMSNLQLHLIASCIIAFNLNEYEEISFSDFDTTFSPKNIKTMIRKIMKKIHYCHNPAIEPLIEILEDYELNDHSDAWSALNKAIEKTFIENTEFDYPILIQNITTKK